jgi:N-alpha-acetyltransferase 15/16, NatA auxiliary subunit
MKGLILTHTGKRDEGIELVKKGVRLDLTSHISWHVFGLIQKGEKNYEEALKSYSQALKFDKVRSLPDRVIHRIDHGLRTM